MHNKAGRTGMSKRNVMVSLVGRTVGMITSFVGRSVFVSTLGSEFLGLGGFFGNIFAVVSLCELGLGTAISQSLYKPLANNDKYRVSAIMKYFSKVYTVVAFVMFFLSIVAIPLLDSIVKSSIDFRIILLSYLLFAAHTFISYILAPKRMLVVCDQRMYVVTAVRSIFGIVALAVQCIALIVTGNYIVYLASRIIMLSIEDIVICRYADKNYPFLSVKGNVSKEYKKSLFSNVKALIWHKLGGTICRSTDSILVSYFVGLSGMGKFSNYALVIGTIGAFFDVAINAVSASVGNLGAGDRGEKSERIMRRMYFINFWLLTVGSCIIVSVLNPFIELWLGKDMLFSNAEMLVITASFYFSCIRDPVQIFVSSYGLFKESRYIPVVRAAVNLILSVIFVQKMGIAGVFLGTVLSTVSIPLFGEVRVLYKYGFSIKPYGFYKNMLCSIFVSFISAGLCFAITSYMSVTYVGVLLRMVVSFGISNLFLLLLFSETMVFGDTLKMLKLKKRAK